MSIIILILILALLIFVHELGHFLFAKMFNIRVDAFALGFKPTLFQKKIGETNYMLNLIPFGGYVKIFGEDYESAMIEPRSFVYKKWWQQILVLLAGVIFNIMLAFMLLIIIFAFHEPFFQAVAHGFSATGELFIEITKAFAQLVGGIFYGQAELETLTGPVGLVNVVGEASRLGFLNVLGLTAIISLNLGVLNLIPFPALDGGRILFVIIEKLKGSPIKPNIAGWINGIGFLLLIMLMLVVTVKDVLVLV